MTHRTPQGTAKTSSSRFPADLAALLGCSYVLLPIAILSTWAAMAIYSTTRTGDLNMPIVGGAFGAIGVVILFFARLPLYRQGRFFSFGPSELDPLHRRLYIWG